MEISKLHIWETVRYCKEAVIKSIKSCVTIIADKIIAGGSAHKLSNGETIGGTKQPFYVRNGVCMPCNTLLAMADITNIGNTSVPSNIEYEGGSAVQVSADSSKTFYVDRQTGIHHFPASTTKGLSIVSGANIHTTLCSRYVLTDSSFASQQALIPATDYSAIKIIEITSWTSGDTFKYLGKTTADNGCKYYVVNRSGMDITITAEGNYSATNQHIVCNSTNTIIRKNTCACFVKYGYGNSALREG